MKINANGTEIAVLQQDSFDYLSLTDLAKKKNPSEPRIVIANWMSNYSTIDFLAVWENLNNPSFNRMEFQSVRNAPGRLVMTPGQWIEKTNAVGIVSRAGRYGGTYAHSDIAFEFASWISPEFKLYVIKDYQRLKHDESERLAIGWDTKRELSKINYRIHTDAIKEFIITPELSSAERNYVYANEADMLNLALFGMTAKQWREKSGQSKLNLRDCASVEELIVLVNLESMNADMIREGVDEMTRLQKLRHVAFYQLQSLRRSQAGKRIEEVARQKISAPKTEKSGLS